MTDEAFRDRQRGKYEDALAALAPGSRDANLVSVALYGRQAGLAPGELFDDIMERAPGAKRPDAAAVRRAVDRAARTCELGGRRGGCAPNPALAAYDRLWAAGRTQTAAERREAARKALPDRVRGTVARLAAEGRGATSRTLMGMSPTPIPPDPAGQAAAHLETLGADWRWKAWAGEIGPSVPGGKRGGVCFAPSLADAIRAGLAGIPTHVSLNPLTGGEGRTGGGKPSFDCAATVAAFPFALMEFDGLPLADQCAVFAALIRRKPGRIVSVVYSGGKSLHAVMLMPECDDRRVRTKTLAEDVRDGRTGADEARWAENMEALRRSFASSDDPAERIDLAPTMNPAVHTRLAGAFRADRGRRQSLLYLDRDLARRELEVF